MARFRVLGIYDKAGLPFIAPAIDGLRAWSHRSSYRNVRNALRGTFVTKAVAAFRSLPDSLSAFNCSLWENH
jgi:hypothetical protein